MQFFDLNIPYLEGDKSIPDKSSKKQMRLKLIVKSMELGYSGIAYNRTIKGSMSESDRCTIPPFPLSSLLNVSPSLSSTVAFHRRLLGVPETTPFRQYTRLTLIVESPSQTAALNSGNPVLKTFDLVAVRPLNQNSFDHACQSSQVDLISIDFAEKFPFRLKLPMVKAAIARGVYFEITYSSLMEDVQVRRQMISNAKLLVEWTRGKNLILSSAAPSVLKLRGPNDVANLSSLLGLSVEHAKAAMSKNCRLLISNALRKKHFYKEAIRVEVMPAGTQTDPKDPWIVDSFDWDPISSGEGDLLLDDMAKSFAKFGKVSQTVKAIDFDSIVNSASSLGLQAKDVDFKVEGESPSSDNVIDNVSKFKDLKSSTETEELQKELNSSLLDQQSNAGEKPEQETLRDSPKACLAQEGLERSWTSSLQVIEMSGTSDPSEAIISCGGSLESEMQNCGVDHSENMLVSSNIGATPSRDVELNVGCSVHLNEEVPIRSEDLSSPSMEEGSRQQVSGVLNATEAGISSELQLDQSLSPSMSLSGHVLQLKDNSTLHADKMMDVDLFLGCNVSGSSVLGDLQLLKNLAKDQEQREENKAELKTPTESSLLQDTMMQVDSYPESNSGEDQLVAKPMPSESLVGESQSISNDNKTGNRRRYRTLSSKALRFPFKRLLQVQFKKKGATSMYKSKKRK